MRSHTTYEDWHPMDTRDHLERAITRVAARYGIPRRRPEAPRTPVDASNDANAYREPDESFGGALRALRDSRCLSQSQFARRAGCDPSFVSRVESGRRRVSRAMIDRFADALRATDAERERLLMSAGYGFALEPDVETFRSYPPEVRAKVLELLAVMGGEA